MIYNKPTGHAPWRDGTIYGDVMLGVGGLEVSEQCVKSRMRLQCKLLGRYGIAEHHSGLKAKLVLEKYLWPNSYDMVMELLKLNPDHVIEFMCFNKAWGTLPNHNTVIYEIRNR